MKFDLVSGYLKILFRQFPLLMAVRQAAARAARAIFDPYCIPSYSQTGEDRIIESLLPNQTTGFYVDVGCNQPIANSNTFKLYRRGWSGINVDANDELIQAFEHLRPRDKNVCCIVSDKEGTMVFNLFEDSLFSTVSANLVENLRESRRVVQSVIKQSRTLTDILVEGNAPNRFDLLSIDVEGHDFEVLRSLNTQKFIPRLIVVEMHGFDINRPNDNPVYVYLAKNNYRLVAYAVMNGYFMHNE